MRSELPGSQAQVGVEKELLVLVLGLELAGLVAGVGLEAGEEGQFTILVKFYLGMEKYLESRVSLRPGISFS